MTTQQVALFLGLMLAPFLRVLLFAFARWLVETCTKKTPRLRG